MSANTYWLSSELLTYVRQVSVNEHPALTALRRATAGMEHAVMQISPEQGNFMQMLVKLINAGRCLEVGVFTGYSALSVALAIPPDGVIRAFDVSEEWTRIAREHWAAAGVAHKIKLTLEAAEQGLQTLLDHGEAGTYDFAFIDADKPGYPVYYEKCMSLVRPGGVIMIDNTLWEQKVIDPAHQDPDTVAIRKINEIVFADPRVTQSLLPLGDGVTIVFKRRPLK